MQPLLLDVPRSVLDRFRRKAKAVFPKEAYAFLLGRKDGDSISIVDLWIPEDLDKYSTNGSVEIPDHWVHQCGEYCEEENLAVHGDCHSHPFLFEECNGKLLGTSPSRGDWAIGWPGICGITSIAQQRDGRLKTSSNFYGPGIPVSTRFTRGKAA